MQSLLGSPRSAVLSQLDLSLAFVLFWVVFVPLHHFDLLSFDFLWHRATKTELAIIFVFVTFAATVGWVLHATLRACRRIILRVISKESVIGIVLLAVLVFGGWSYLKQCAERGQCPPLVSWRDLALQIAYDLSRGR
jgi:hypothetical protein